MKIEYEESTGLNILELNIDEVATILLALDIAAITVSNPRMKEAIERIREGIVSK